MVTNLRSVETNGAGIAFGKSGRVGRRWKQFPVTGFDAFEVALRDPGLRRNILELELFRFARRTQPLANGGDAGFDQIFVHRLAFR